MSTQQGSEIFSAIIAAPFGAMGIRTEDGRLRELVYLPPHYHEKSAQDAVAEQAAVQVARYFEDPDFPTGLDRISDYRLVEQNWRREFLGYHRDGLCWTTIFHPKIVAKPGRLQILEGLFREINQRPDVWIAHGAEIARWWIADNEDAS